MHKCIFVAQYFNDSILKAIRPVYGFIKYLQLDIRMNLELQFN